MLYDCRFNEFRGANAALGQCALQVREFAKQYHAGVADFYGSLLDGIVCDEPPWEGALRMLRVDTSMSDARARARVAEQTLAFADSLAG